MELVNNTEEFKNLSPELQDEISGFLLENRKPELLVALESAKDRLEKQINATPTGEVRNKLAEDNAKVLTLINYINDEIYQSTKLS